MQQEFYLTLITELFDKKVPSDTAAVSLVSVDRGTAAVPVAQTELQATDTAAVARVTATCDTAAVRLAGALATRRPGIVRCFVVYPTQTPCFHSVPVVRRLVAGVCAAGAACALAINRPPTDPSGCINLLPKCKLYSGVNLAHSIHAYSVERALSVSFRA